MAICVLKHTLYIFEVSNILFQDIEEKKKSPV